MTERPNPLIPIESTYDVLKRLAADIDAELSRLQQDTESSYSGATPIAFNRARAIAVTWASARRIVARHFAEALK